MTDAEPLKVAKAVVETEPVDEANLEEPSADHKTNGIDITTEIEGRPTVRGGASTRLVPGLRPASGSTSIGHHSIPGMLSTKVEGFIFCTAPWPPSAFTSRIVI